MPSIAFSIADPARWLPISIAARASRSVGSRRTVSKFGSRWRHAAREYAWDTALRLVQTYDSTAWARASTPVTAVTGRGWDNVSSGSRTATRNAAFLSPQAILTRVRSSVIRA